jgi:hypothetical protein
VSARALAHLLAFARQQLVLFLAAAQLAAHQGSSGDALREPLPGQTWEAAEALAMVALTALAQLLKPHPGSPSSSSAQPGSPPAPPPAQAPAAAAAPRVAPTLASAELLLNARGAVAALLPLLAECAAAEGLPSPTTGVRRAVAAVVRLCAGATTVAALRQRAADAEARAAAAEAALAASRGGTASHAAACQEGYATGFAF